MADATTQQRLAACLAALKAQIARHSDGHCRTPRFDRQLFSASGTRLADYLQELERNQQLLCTSSNGQERGRLAAQQQLKQELEVLEGRMARCRQAIDAVKWALSLRGEAL